MSEQIQSAAISSDSGSSRKKEWLDPEVEMLPASDAQGPGGPVPVPPDLSEIS